MRSLRRHRFAPFTARLLVGGVSLGLAAGLVAGVAVDVADAEPTTTPSSPTGSAAPSTPAAANGGGHAQAGQLPPRSGAASPEVSSATPSGYAVTGIDIASYQHPGGAAIDWNAVKASGRTFAFIKATEGTTYTNPYYRSDFAQARAAGLYVGAYHYARPDVNNPEAQATYLLSVTGYAANAPAGTIVPFLDIEGGAAVGVGNCYGLTPSQMVAWISRFLAQFRAMAGRDAAIYTGNGFWSSCVGNSGAFANNPLDVARWSSSPYPLPGGWTTPTFWQYGSSDTVPGIIGNVDGMVFVGSRPQLDAFTTPLQMANLVTVVADVTGDGRPDVVTSTGYSVMVAKADGAGFDDSQRWSFDLFAGTRGLVAADVNGDGKADLVAINDTSTWVILSSGTGFSAPTPWSAGRPFYGQLRTVATDYDGDGKADLLAVNTTSTWVLRSTGSTFSAPALTSSGPFYGDVVTLPGKLAGSGRSDLVAVNRQSSWVLRNDPSGFTPPTQWSATPFYGNRATIAADLNGDGRMDLLAVNDGSVWVISSTGSGYAAPVQVSLGQFYGVIGVYAGDINGDGKADLIAVSLDSIWVMQMQPNGFGGPAKWQ